MGKHKLLSLDTHKYKTTFTSTTKIVLRFSNDMMDNGIVDNKCCCRSQSVVVVDIAQCDMIIWCACTQYLVLVVCCRFYATLICIKKRGVVDNRCCYYTRVAVAVVVTQRSSPSKLAIIFAFEQIRSLSFYCHRIQLIAVCHGRGTCREYGVHAHVWWHRKEDYGAAMKLLRRRKGVMHPPPRLCVHAYDPGLCVAATIKPSVKTTGSVVENAVFYSSFVISPMWSIFPPRLPPPYPSKLKRILSTLNN